jgi:AbrB family looped-hinge helix DNA binding protein
METIRLSTKGQLVIPNEIRKAHHLRPGTRFVVSFVGTEIRLTPVAPFAKRTVDDAAGLLAKRGRRRKIGADTTRRKIQQTLKARDAATRS